MFHDIGGKVCVKVHLLWAIGNNEDNTQLRTESIEGKGYYKKKITRTKWTLIFGKCHEQKSTKKVLLDKKK